MPWFRQVVYHFSPCDAYVFTRIRRALRWQERNWFRHGNEPAPYEEVFTSNFDDDKVFFEFSPNYLTDRSRASRNAIADRIKKELPDSHILLAIRHPLHRAVSHYLHQLQHFARFGTNRWAVATRQLQTPFKESFEQAVATDPVLMADLADTATSYLDRFGQDKCRFFFMERDIKQMPHFYSALRTWLGMPADDSWEHKQVPHALNSERHGYPRYFAAGTQSGTVQVGDDRIELPAGTLYIASALEHELVGGLDPLHLRAMHGAAQLWTTDFDLNMMQQIFERHYREDLEKFDALVRPLDPTMPDYLSMPLKPKTLEPQPVDEEFLRQALSIS